MNERDEFERLWKEYTENPINTVTTDIRWAAEYWFDNGVTAATARSAARIAELESQLTKTFPVQGWGKVHWYIGQRAWEKYATKHGREQSCERIVQRGGLSCREMDIFSPGWREEDAGIKKAEANAAEFEASATRLPRGPLMPESTCAYSKI
jgi:hypothetical protein